MDLELLKEKIKEFSSRSELSKKNNTLYSRILRTPKYRNILDEVLPKLSRETWTEEMALDLLQYCRSKTDYHDRFGGAYAFLYKKKLTYKIDEYFENKKKREEH